jgi:hypothetical protein
VTIQEEEERQKMERTWKPKAAGILCIIAGIISLIPATIVGVFFGLWSPVSDEIGLIFFAPLIPLLLFGIIQIVGGIYALRRRRWGLALVGSICCTLAGLGLLALFFVLFLIGSIAVWPRTTEIGDTMIIGFIVGFVIFGILPIVFVVKGRREFK